MSLIYKNFIKKGAFLSVLISTAYTSPTQTFAYTDHYPAYINGNSVNFRREPSLDSKIIMQLQNETELIYISDEEGWTKVEYENITGYISSDFITYNELHSPHELYSPEDADFTMNVPDDVIAEETVEATIEPPKTTASDFSIANGIQLTPWSTAKSHMLIGVDAVILDLYTGITYNVRSFSNGNHADVEPSTATDTELMFETFDKRWKWNPRPVLVTIDGVTMAASINGMPHASGVNHNNNMDGQICLHFLGSSTHNVNDSFTSWHQEEVLNAYDIATSSH